MRGRALWLLFAFVLGGASTAFAQEPDDDAATEEPPAPEPSKEDEREPFVKRDGQVADNEQLGGEPSLTEPEPSPAEAVPPEECDLDCIEAQLAAEEEREQQRKGTLRVARERDTDTEPEAPDAGDSLAAEPSTIEIDATEIEVPEDQALPTRLGPVRIPVGKTDDWVGIGLATQLEFAYEQDFGTAGFPKESFETLEFRRIRLTISSSFIEGRIRSRFQINLTPSAFELIDLWFAFTRFQFATFRLGQFKIPYDRYRAQSFAALSFVDWAPTTRMFGSERQVGAEMLASGGIFDLEYSVGIFSGVNARAAHGVGIAEVYGEVPQNASNFGTGEVVSAFHPELAGRVAKNFGKIDTASNSDVLQTDHLRHSLGAGIAWDARPLATEDLGLRLQVEWLGKFKGFYFNLINYLAWYEPWQGGKILFGPLGVMAETGYRFTLIWELAIRYSVTYLTPWLRSDARSYGEFRIAEEGNTPEAQLQYGRNGDQTTNNDLALAGSSRIIGNSLKVTAEVAWQQQLWNTGRRNGLRVNLQLQLVF